MTSTRVQPTVESLQTSATLFDTLGGEPAILRNHVICYQPGILNPRYHGEPPE